MKVSNASQKATLYNLFFEVIGQDPSGQLVARPVQLPIDKLLDAASACKKLLVGSTQKGILTRFNDDEVSFTPNESAVLKGLFDAHSDKWDVTVADTVLALDALFKGKKEKKPPE